jgi:hypothetical protein
MMRGFFVEYLFLALALGLRAYRKTFTGSMYLRSMDEPIEKNGPLLFVFEVSDTLIAQHNEEP